MNPRSRLQAVKTGLTRCGSFSETPPPILKSMVCWWLKSVTTGGALSALFHAILSYGRRPAAAMIAFLSSGAATCWGRGCRGIGRRLRLRRLRGVEPVEQTLRFVGSKLVILISFHARRQI